MSAEQIPEQAIETLVDEVERSRREDPDFAVMLAKARAKARGQVYQADRHGPFEVKRPPRQERQKAMAETRIAGDVDALLARFRSRAPGGRHLKAVPSDRLDEVIQR